MQIGRQVLFWLGAFAAAGLFLYVFSSILLPFVAALFLGYLLDPVADRLEAMGLGRLGAALVILGGFSVFFILLLVLFVPLLVHELSTFIAAFPSLVTRLQTLAVEQGGALSDEYLGGIFRYFGIDTHMTTDEIRSSLGSLVNRGSQWMLTVLQSVWSGGQAIVNIFSLLVVTPVVAFYVLLDWDRMVASIDSCVPRQNRDTVHQIARDIDRAIAGFLRGQSMVCLFLGLWYGIGLSAIGLNFGFLIGIASGLLSFIPYVGSLTALVLSAIIAIVQGWPSWWLFLMSMLVIAIGQFLEGNVLAPRLVGASVGLHPVWLMFSLFAFGDLFGFTGLIVAVPISAAIAVLVRFAVRRYLESPFYENETAEPLSADAGIDPP